MLLLVNATAAPPEPVSLPAPWPEHNEIVASIVEKPDYVSHLAGPDRSPAIRMLEQTIVCLHELDRLGKLTSGQKIELADLIAQHNLIVLRPKVELAAVARAATTVAAS